MRINKKIIGIILVTLLAVGGSVFVSGEDLAVSLDYLLEVFKPEIKAEISEELSFKVLNITAGDRFYGGAGCEFILRGGQATIKASALGGLNDATTGDDLWEGLLVPANHLLIVPRDDERGFVALNDVIIMVKGKYFIGK